MRILLRTLTGKEIPLVVDQTDLIEMVKRQFYDKEGIPPNQQRFICRGRHIDEDGTLLDQGVVPDDVIHVDLRLRGQGSIPSLPFSSCLLPTEVEGVGERQVVFDRNGTVRGTRVGMKELNFGSQTFRAERPMLPPVSVGSERALTAEFTWVTIGSPTLRCYRRYIQDSTNNNRVVMKMIDENSFRARLDSENLVYTAIARAREMFNLGNECDVKFYVKTITGALALVEKDADLVEVPHAIGEFVAVTNFLNTLESWQLASFSRTPIGRIDRTTSFPPLIASTTCHFAELNKINNKSDNDNSTTIPVTRVPVVVRRFNFNDVFGDEAENEKYRSSAAQRVPQPSEAQLKNFIAAFNRDAKQLSKLPPHPNLAPILGVIKQDARITFRKSSRVVHSVPRYIIHDRYDTSLAEMIERRALTKDTARRVVKSVFRALTHLHKHKIVAGCIKPENILINYAKSDSDADSAESKAMKVVLVDYGWTQTSQQLDELITGDLDDGDEDNDDDEEQENKKDCSRAKNAKRNAPAETTTTTNSQILQKTSFERRLLAAPEMDSATFCTESIDIWDLGVLCLHIFDYFRGGSANVMNSSQTPTSGSCGVAVRTSDTIDRNDDESGSAIATLKKFYSRSRSDDHLGQRTINNLFADLRKVAGDDDETSEMLLDIARAALHTTSNHRELKFI